MFREESHGDRKSGLWVTDLYVGDRQNVEAAERLTRKDVRNALKE